MGATTDVQGSTRHSDTSDRTALAYLDDDHVADRQIVKKERETFWTTPTGPREVQVAGGLGG